MSTDLTNYRDKYDGERIFLIGNGPSLKYTPLERLENEYTFGVNKIHSIYEYTDWRPSFYVCVSPKGKLRNYIKTIELGIPCFISKEDKEFFPDSRNVHYFNNESIDEIGNPNISKHELDLESIEDYQRVWSNDIEQVVYRYNTVMYPTMQIAAYMGFDEIYLVGCDLYEPFEPHLIFDSGSDPVKYTPKYDSSWKNKIDFLVSDGKPIRSFANGIAYKFVGSDLFEKSQPILVCTSDKFKDKSHFTDSYWSRYVDSHKVNLRHRLNHELAKKICNKKGIQIYNATIGGYLDIYPRVDLYNVLSRNK